MKKIVLSIALLLVSGITTAQDYRQLLKEFLKQNKEQHFSRSGLPDFTVDNEDYSESMKASVLKLQQTLHGIPVFNGVATALDRKSTRLNSSHVKISYAVFCLKKKNIVNIQKQLYINFSKDR